ncbi:MAG TPA: DUF4126 family protein [Terriglobales bacterium]|jgi:uncharacterized membrane protein|nr:DUF4126 family protein [Terriglobales bacterium]
MNYVMLLALGIGFVAGLRSLTAPAFVAWAAHLQALNLRGSPLAWMGSPIAVGIFTLLAILELISDVLPKTPPRTAPLGLIARIIMGGLCGACIYAAGAAVPITGAVVGIVGALIGTYGGYYARRWLGSRLGVKDVLIAIPEDILAFVLAWCVVR